MDGTLLDSMYMWHSLSSDFLIEHSDTVIYNDTTFEAFLEASRDIALALKE